jgi:formamidase
VPTYNNYLIFEGVSVDEAGTQHYLDVHIAYRQACLNAIEYLTRFGYSRAQAYAILGTAPVQGHISRVVDIPNASATLWLPTDIFAFDVMPGAEGAIKHTRGGIDIPMSPDKCAWWRTVCPHTLSGAAWRPLPLFSLRSQSTE